MGLPYAIESLDKATKDFISHFYTFMSGLEVSNVTNSAYVRIWKAGNMAIAENMRVNPAFGAIDPLNEEDVPRFVLNRTRVRYWTFVREPVIRFLSGYNEFEGRLVELKGLQSEYEPYKPTFLQYDLSKSSPTQKEERFISLIKDILMARFPLFMRNFSTEHKHFYPMSGIFHRIPQIHYVARLNNVTHEWPKVQKYELHMTKITQFDVTRGQHETSKDPLQSYAAAKRVVRKYPHVVRALCYLLWPDYLCFGFPRPPACEP